MGGALIAIEALSALLTASQHAAEAMQAIQSLLGTAHAEGRDLTDAEVQQVIDTRKAAEAKLQAIAAAPSTLPPSAPATGP